MPSSQKNIQVVQYISGQMVNLFPKTKALLVEMGNGKTVEQYLGEVISSLITSEQVDNRIRQVVGAAPQSLDTLQEIATALNNDANFAATITTLISGKVDKISGKQLSTEDFTTILKTKLENLSTVATTGDYNSLLNKPAMPSLNNTVTSTSATEAATANAVKISYDKAVSAENRANTKTRIYVGTTAPGDLSSGDIFFAEI